MYINNINKKFFLVLFSLFLCLLFLLNTCFITAEQKNNPDINQNKNIKILNLSMCPPKTFNPLNNTDPTVDKIFRLTFESLLKINSDYTIENRLIKDIIFNEDNSADISLRQDILWTDQTNLNSDDVLFSIEQIKSADRNSLYKYIADKIVSYKKISDYKLNIKFKDGAYISSYLLDFPVVQKKYFSSHNLNDVKNSFELPVCNGAYKFDDYKKMKSLSLIKNPNYFLSSIEDYNKNQNLDDFDKINIIIVPEKETSIFSFNQGLINVIETDLKNIGKFKRYTKEIDKPTNELEFIYLNTKNNIFSIEQLRKAFINILEINNIREKIYSQDLSKSLLSTKQDDYYKNNINNIKKIIADCDIKSNLKILINSNNIKRENTAIFIKKKLADFNINSEIEKKSFNEYQTDFYNKNYDIFIGGFNSNTYFDYDKLFASENIFGYEDLLINNKWQNVKHALSKNVFDSAIEDLRNSMRSSFLIITGSRNKKILFNIKPTQSLLNLF